MLAILLLTGICLGQSVWEIKNPLPQGNSLYSAVYGDSQFVAVGDKGTILTSPDAATWTVKKSGTKFLLSSVTFGNGHFVTVGDSGMILISPDGTTWARKTEIDTFHMNGSYGFIVDTLESWLRFTTYQDSQFVIVGNEGKMLISLDASRWMTEYFTPPINFYSVTHGNGQFVIIGNGDTIFISTDGGVGTVRNSGLPDWISSVTFGNNQFVATGSDSNGNSTILTSPDGIVWKAKRLGLATSFHYITYVDSQFIAVGDKGTIFTSPDATLWAERNSGTTIPLFFVTYGNGLFVAVGDSGMIITSRADNITAIQTGDKKPSSGGFRINVRKNVIAVTLRETSIHDAINIGLFTIAGKRIYSAIHPSHNRVLNIPVQGLSKGRYLISITGSNATLSSSFVLTN
jgi:photosystem II stability/assembly factor-like uncharacterized protein